MQEIWLEGGQVLVEQGTLLARKRTASSFLLRQLDLTRSTAHRRPHWLWLLAGLAFLAAGVVNLLDGTDRGSLASAVQGSLLGLALAGYWLVNRTTWTGYGPLWIWDVGDKTDAILEEVHRHRLFHLIGETAEVMGNDAALEAIAMFERDEVVSPKVASELRSEIRVKGTEPGGYL